MPTHNTKTKREHKGKFVGVSEIGRMAGVTRARAGQMVWDPWFPPYVEVLDMGTLWDEAEVRAALAAQGYPRGSQPRPLAEVAA